MYRPLRVKEVPNRKGDLATLPAHVLRTAAEGRYVRWKGHAAKPNTGPYPETCGGCASLYMHKDGNRKASYPKCALSKGDREDGAKTDIAKKDPACVWWTKAPPSPPKPPKEPKPRKSRARRKAA